MYSLIFIQYKYQIVHYTFKKGIIMDKDVYKCDLSSDYLLALNNILKRTRRKTASKEELARELNMPLSEIEIPCSYLVEYGYAFPDDSDRFEIYDFGTKTVEEYQKIHAGIARYLKDTLKIDALEACRNAAAFRNLMQDETVEDILQYVEERHLPKLDEEDITIIYPALHAYISETRYDLLDPIYFLIEGSEHPQSETFTVQDFMNMCNMSPDRRQTVEKHLKKAQEQGLIEINKNGSMSLTSEGCAKCMEYVKKQLCLVKFFEYTLNYDDDDESAGQSAWACKYRITDAAFTAVEEYLKKNGIDIGEY